MSEGIVEQAKRVNEEQRRAYFIMIARGMLDKIEEYEKGIADCKARLARAEAQDPTLYETGYPPGTGNLIGSR